MIALATLSCLTGMANVLSFAPVLTDNAVLQRDVAVPIWGKGPQGAEVTVFVSGQAVAKTKVGEDGRWRADLPAHPADATPSTVTAVAGSDRVEIKNILFGDVWFGCGQSNMAYTFAGYGRLPIGGEAFLQKAKGNPNIRTLLMNDGENRNLAYPREDAVGVQWETSTYDAIRRNGAALYWMGWKLNQELDIPIGLVNASWGATKIDGWIDQNWAKDHGTGYGKGIASYWWGRWNDFVKAGGAEAYEKAIVDWSKRYDPGYLAERSKPSLHDADYDDSAWKPVEPSDKGFQDDPFPKDFHGDIWLRATFVMTDEDIKKGWMIGYNNSFGQDMTYLNGKAFGGSGNPNHGYGMPQSVVGTNVLAIRYKVWGAKDGKAGGMHKPVAMSVCPSGADRREFDLKACIGEAVPSDIWNHPEARKPGDARAVTMFSATSMDSGLVHPLYPMAIKGAVWYQGCSDLGNGKYPELFKTLVEAWRAQFTYKDRLPVLITEICPHQLDTKPNSQGRIDAGETAQPTWSVNADMRRQLNELATFLPDCDTISLLDLGEKDIHPIHKEEVGTRYANWALQHVYGKDIEGSSPQVASVEWQGPKAIIHLKNAKGLKTSDGKPVKGFELGGPVEAGTEIDKQTGKPKEGVVYYYCDAKIVGDTIELSCPEVKEAFAFHYAWFDLGLGWNVVNGAGLPLGTCRAFKDGTYHSQIIPPNK